MKKYAVPAILTCLLIGIGTTLAGSVSDELKPEAISARIAKHRMGDLMVAAKPGAAVHIEQLRHEFWFGAAISSGVFSGWTNAEDQRKYKETFLANFNAAVTENAVKWASMERRQGQVDYHIVDAILAWTEEHDIPLRGHNVFWGIPNRVQDWLKEMNDDELRKTLEHRAKDIASRYKGRFAEYDLNNEMLHANYYEDRLGPGITKDMANWFKEADPGAKLFLNDYDVLTGNRLDDYIKHIHGFLDQGVPFAGIGVQGHIHGETFDPEALQNALGELAKIGLPIRITEFNMPGQRSRFMRQRNLKLTEQEEQAKAEALAQYYRICFAHPAVEGILMWGFWERANWIPQSAIYRRDWTPTPAAEAYRNLVFKEWWTSADGKAGEDGRYRLRAFYGKYAVTCEGQRKEVLLGKDKGQVTIRFE